MNPVFVIAAALLTPEAPYEPATEISSHFEVQDPHYADCVALVAEGAEKARAEARKWLTEAGGAPAHHCLAVADLAAGQPVLAAIRLTEIAERSDAGDRFVRARLLAQAARAWLDAGENEEAGKAISAAFAETPEFVDPFSGASEGASVAAGAGELHLTAAAVFAANERWQATVDAVTIAETDGIVSLAGYVNRARAFQALSKPRDAAEDVVAALKIDAFNVDALVLRGELLQAGVDIKANYARKEGAAQ